MAVRVERLKQRKDFLRIAASGVRYVRPSMVMQSAPSSEVKPDVVRLGFTTSKKLGGAVDRNRIRRRLKVAATQLAGEFGRAGFDYVIIGRRKALNIPFDTLVSDMQESFQRIHRVSRKNCPDSQAGCAS